MPYTPAELFARAAFYPTLLYTYVTTRATARKWYSRIDNTVLMGALPIRSVAKKLVEEEGVRGVVSVNEDFETKTLMPSEQEWQALGVRQLKVPTTDFTGTPTHDQIRTAVDFIVQYREQNDSVYVHCKAGRTRSATVVACYLVKVNLWTPEEAVSFIKSKRPQIWLRDKQLKSVSQFYNSCVKQASASNSMSATHSKASNKSVMSQSSRFVHSDGRCEAGTSVSGSSLLSEEDGTPGENVTGQQRTNQGRGS